MLNIAKYKRAGAINLKHEKMPTGGLTFKVQHLSSCYQEGFGN